MKKLFDFLKRVEEAEEMTADTEKVKDGIWTVNRNQTNTDYEGGDYQNPRIAIMYDGTQGHNGWFWEVIEGKNVIGTSDSVFKTADGAKEDAESWIDRLNAESDPEPDLGRIGETVKFYKGTREVDSDAVKIAKAKVKDRKTASKLVKMMKKEKR
ncbi:unnamed protein product [marine sediment metagenome]|uniref:Uncharacterized protein n=1 Tax=marine sediment metagenome TaxID=412755 RepID=X0T3N4_9ZZZZ